MSDRERIYKHLRQETESTKSLDDNAYPCTTEEYTCFVFKGSNIC